MSYNPTPGAYNPSLPQGSVLALWIIYSENQAHGLSIQGIFTDFDQAERAMLWHKESDRNNSTFYIRDASTEPHLRNEPHPARKLF